MIACYCCLGWIDACAGPLLRYRRQIGGSNIAVFCDIKKKHSAHAVTQDVDIAETARAAAFFRADGVIITGSITAIGSIWRWISRVYLGSMSSDVHSCTHWLRPRNPLSPHSPALGLVYEGAIGQQR